MEIHGILKTPVEIRSAILRQLPRVEDIFSAIQSNRSLYEALGEDKTTVSHVLHKQIDAKLLPYAAAFLEHDKTLRITRHQKDVILENYFSLTSSQASEKLGQISLREARHVMDLHNTVQRLATKYSAQALALIQNEELFKTSMLSFTPSEIYRIERSFYTLELYCSLFGQSRSRLSRDDQIDLFFKRFAPWENEQLACVHDFLLDELKPAFNEVAAHDIRFGELSIPWVKFESSWIQGYLSLGVNYLEKVITASTYEERHRLLDEKLLLADNTPVLAECLIDSNDLYFGGETDELDDHAMRQLRQLPSPYTACDPDTGPAEIWFQAHEGDDRTQYVSAEPHRASRKIGYVMMDLSRRQDIASFDGPQKSIEWDNYDDENYHKEYARQLKSFEIRSEIYLRGGRGWWSEGDTTRIQWHDPSGL
ncbi:zinc finger domain protein [Penicillium frequentans]|nr:zinc finger domain protein [Penicillium glabrum]